MMRNVLITLVVVLSLVATCSANHKYIYGIVVDAGSSGSRIYIYQYLHRVNNTLPDLSTAPLNQSQWSFKVNPGLSTFYTNLTGIPYYLTPLITYAKNKLPATEWSETAFFLKATGGLRALAQSDQDAVMTAARNFLRTTPFNFTDAYAQVIPLQIESLYGWIAANYLNGLTGSATATAGALDMGGASTEIAFAAPEAIQNVSVALGQGYSYSIYASGFNARGQDDAFAVTNSYLVATAADTTVPIEHPCYHVGYNETWKGPGSGSSYMFYGSGNVTSCRILVNAALLNTTVDCPVAPCSFEGHYQPNLPANMNFFAYSAFAYTYQVYFPTAPSLQLTSLGDFSSTNINWCNQNWTYTRSLFSTSAQSDLFLRRYCWSGAYFSELLRVYGFQSTVKNIYFGTSVRSIEVTWALGSMLSDAALLPYSPNPSAPTAAPTVAPTTATNTTTATPTTATNTTTAMPTTATPTKQPSTTGPTAAVTTGANVSNKQSPIPAIMLLLLLVVAYFA